MDERACWNCGHLYEMHKFEGGCAVRDGEERCDCPGYEDAEYLGRQKKRDIYTLSDRRRLTARRR
ncbi:MAG TPA: hypothetical protein VFX96_04925 [Pyrinomonadaceae bacterium]|nr:hypothetical protein [Pyrinomonadaceae bacterium]